MLMAADSELSSSTLSHPLLPNSVETLDESSSSSQIASTNAPSSPNRIRGLSETMLTADSGISSHSSVIPNSIEALDDSSSFQIAPFNADIVQSSPIRDSDSMVATDGSSSSSSSLELEEGVCNDTQISPESPILPLNQFQNFPQAPVDINDALWNVDSSYPRVNHHLHRRRRSRYVDLDDSEDDDDTLLKPFPERFKRFEEPITGVGAGLWNLGNTCFINSVLQCLTHSVPLLQSLFPYKCKTTCNCENYDFCVITALRWHIESALNPFRFPIRPFIFLHNLNYFSPYFQRYHQEDAHEFLQAFLDKLEKCCVDQRSNRDGDGDGDSDISSSPTPEVNIVDQVFTGRLVSELRCCNCNSVSETFESSLGISLEIEDVDTLSSALDSFTRVEKLEELMTCDKCEEKVSKEKRLLIEKLPLVVSFHLKRFKNNGIYTEKIFKHVETPLVIDLNPYMQKTQENTKYHLYAFVEHFGYSLTYGHYSSYVRSAPGTWHKFDDSQVTRIDEDCVLSQDPYILFYAREGTHWFSTVYEEFTPPFPLPRSFLDSSFNGGGGGGGECLSEISYENNNVDKAICVYNKPERDVCMKAEEEEEGESSGDDQDCDQSDSDGGDTVDLSTERKEEFASSVFRNRYSSLKQQGKLQTWKKREKEEACIVDSKETDEKVVWDSNEKKKDSDSGETLKTNGEDEEEEACKTLSDVVDLKETGFVHCGGGGGRELDQGIDALETGSPSKKMKTE